MEKIEVSIIITAEHKEKFIERTINSCSNQNFKNFEIIVSYTKLKNIGFLKKKFRSKNIIFYKIRKKRNNKIQDQLNKIYRSVIISRGKNIVLLDGDDEFTKNKLKKISPILNSKNVVVLNSFLLNLKNKNLTKKVIQKEKSNFFKVIVNPWPKGICTSCISLRKKSILNFYKTIDFKKFNYLAIDILLVIFFYNQNKIYFIRDFLTIKNENKNSVDTFFRGYLNKYYWLRRQEQHYFYKSFVKKYLNLDLIITKLFNFFIKFSS